MQAIGSAKKNECTSSDRNFLAVYEIGLPLLGAE